MIRDCPQHACTTLGGSRQAIVLINADSSTLTRQQTQATAPPSQPASAEGNATKYDNTDAVGRLALLRT